MPAEDSNNKPSDLVPVVLPEYLQEDDLSQQCKELVATLPAEPGWVANQLHQYQGFWHTTRHMQGVLNCQNHFQAYDSDIILITSPKSGTTWLKALTFATLNRKNYYPNPNPETTRTGQTHHHSHPLLTTNPHVLVPFLELNQYLHKTKPDLSLFSSPRLFSSHLPYVSLPESTKSSGCKIVYLCRNPKDIFVSLWHFTNRLRPETKGSNSIEDSFDKFCRGVSLYGPFWDHMLGYYKASLERPDKIMFLRFEELKAEPDKVLKQLAEFTGCGFSREEESGGNVVSDILKLCSFENLSNLEVNKKGKLSSGEENNTFFRRGEVGDWKNYLSSQMVEQLDVIIQDKLEKQGLKF